MCFNNISDKEDLINKVNDQSKRGSEELFVGVLKENKG